MSSSNTSRTPTASNVRSNTGRNADASNPRSAESRQTNRNALASGLGSSGRATASPRGDTRFSEGRERGDSRTTARPANRSNSGSDGQRGWNDNNNRNWHGDNKHHNGGHRDKWDDCYDDRWSFSLGFSSWGGWGFGIGYNSYGSSWWGYSSGWCSPYYGYGYSYYGSRWGGWYDPCYRPYSYWSYDPCPPYYYNNWYYGVPAYRSYAYYCDPCAPVTSYVSYGYVYSPPVVYTTPVYETVYVQSDPVYVEAPAGGGGWSGGPVVAAPPQNSIADAWVMLSTGWPDESLAAFESLVDALPNDGQPLIGVAISAALMDKDIKAAAAMRQAMRIDPKSIQFVPVDQKLAAQLESLLERYDARAKARYGDTDALFMAASLHYLLGNDQAADYALHAATQFNDNDASTMNLRALLDRAAEITP